MTPGPCPSPGGAPTAMGGAPAAHPDNLLPSGKCSRLRTVGMCSSGAPVTEPQGEEGEFSPGPSPGLLLPTCEGHTVMWGWEWYQPTTLMGRPVISANLCVGQGAFGTNRQRENSRVLTGFPVSQQNSRSLWRSDNKQCRELMGASSPAPSGVTAAEANWILFAGGNKQPFSSCPRQHPECVQRRGSSVQHLHFADLPSSTQPPC